MNLTEQVPHLLHTASPYANIFELARGAWEHWIVILSAAVVNLVASNGIEATVKSFNHPWMDAIVNGMGMSWKAAVGQAVLHSLWVGAVHIAASHKDL